MRPGSAARVKRSNGTAPLFRTGDRMSQPAFHRLYEMTVPPFKAELLGGVVYVASPLKIRHGRHEPRLSTVFVVYEDGTPGTEVAGNTTVLIPPDDEPQPDLLLRILPECGGQSRTTPDGYAAGAPELLAQVADTTRRLDLGVRKDRYESAGVLEYIVLSLQDQKLFWFDFQAGDEITADRQGVFRSRVFPGLWIHGPALLDRRLQPLLRTLRQGLRSAEHARFVKRLKRRRRLSSKQEPP